MTIEQLKTLTGGLSTPSKMPCFGFSIPARHCKVGKKLNKIKNTVCEKCYALKGRYSFKNVQDALDRRFKAIYEPSWVEWMVEYIGKKEKSGFFRWHDSGDIQDIQHLNNINIIARKLPNIKFWLPTKEMGIVKKFLQFHTPESNLCIRLSEFYLGEHAKNKAQLDFAKKYGIVLSGANKTGFNCPAPKQANQCGDCRKCWNKNVFKIIYKLH